MIRNSKNKIVKIAKNIIIKKEFLDLMLFLFIQLKSSIKEKIEIKTKGIKNFKSFNWNKKVVLEFILLNNLNSNNNSKKYMKKYGTINPNK